MEFPNEERINTFDASVVRMQVMRSKNTITAAAYSKMYNMAFKQCFGTDNTEDPPTPSGADSKRAKKEPGGNKKVVKKRDIDEQASLDWQDATQTTKLGEASDKAALKEDLAMAVVEDASIVHSQHMGQDGRRSHACSDSTGESGVGVGSDVRCRSAA